MTVKQRAKRKFIRLQFEYCFFGKPIMIEKWSRPK